MLKLSDKTGGRSGTKILLDAMTKDKVHLAKFVLDALDGKIVDSKTESAQTPLISSIFLPDSQARSTFIKLLLQRGASVNHKDECGRTALSHACEKGYLDAVKILVQNNANPEMEDLWGNTALMYAVGAGHSVVVEFLVRAFKRLGLQIDRQNKVGNSALKVAQYLGHKECLYALKNHPKKAGEYDFGAPDTVGVVCARKDGDTQEDAPNKKAPDLCAQKRPLCARHGGASRGLPTAAVGRRRSLILKHRLQSMDSIEEYDKESEGSPTSPQGLFFAAVTLTPKTPQRCSTPQPLRQGEKTGSADDPGHLPPLPRKTNTQSAPQFSPRPFKTVPKSSAPETSSPGCFASTLGILMTPITEAAVPRDEKEQEKVKKTTFDFSIRRFDDSYYQKRCSLPTSLLSPLPPERAQMPVRKFKAAWKNPISQGCPADPTGVPLPPPPTALSVLGNKLLRRFTFPEFKKTGKEVPDGGCSAQAGSGEAAAGSRGIMPRSETFPLCTHHPQVGSKPSIDSISAVKCEFDFQFKVPPPKGTI